MSNNIIRIKLNVSYGRRGVGEPIPRAAASQEYAQYEDYRETIAEKMEITNWDEMTSDTSGIWKLEKYSGTCE